MTRRRPLTARWTHWRRGFQVLVVVAYVVLPLAAARGVTVVAGTLSSLRVGSLDLTEPAAGLSSAFAALALPATLVAGMVPIVLLAILAGPVFCSWICPWGLLSEILDGFAGRRRRSWSGQPWIRARRPRLGALAVVFGLSVVAAVPVAAIVSPPRLLTVLSLEGLYLRLVSPVTAALLFALLLIEIVGSRRILCRCLCPVGGLMNFLRWPRTLTVRFDRCRCLCPATPHCLTACPWGIDPRVMGQRDGCTNCFACVDECPSGALAVGTRRGPRFS